MDTLPLFEITSTATSVINDTGNHTLLHTAYVSIEVSFSAKWGEDKKRWNAL
jgi:hypothetical protein